jgi:hypothetical protein
MRGYILGITGIAILSAIISMISPARKAGKTIDGVLKLCMLSAILLPIVNLFRQTSDIFFTETSITTEDIAYINNSYALAVERYVEEEFTVTVQVEYADKITVYITEIETGTDISELKDRIAQGVAALCNKETEVIYEGA